MRLPKLGYGRSQEIEIGRNLAELGQIWTGFENGPKFGRNLPIQRAQDRTHATNKEHPMRGWVKDSPPQPPINAALMASAARILEKATTKAKLKKVCYCPCFSGRCDVQMCCASASSSRPSSPMIPLSNQPDHKASRKEYRANFAQRGLATDPPQ